MSLNDVIERFKVISQLEPAEISKWLFLCKDSMEFIENNLKKDVSLQSCEMRLANAAAVLAFYKLCLYNGCNSINSFKAGDVQVSVNSLTAEYAKSLWINEQNELCDVLEIKTSDADSFVFMRVVV